MEQFIHKCLFFLIIFQKVFKQNIKPNNTTSQTKHTKCSLNCGITREDEWKVLQHSVVAICSESDQLVHFL